MIPLFIDSTIPDLTRSTRAGARYIRRSNVLTEIESLWEMDEKELERRASVRQEELEHSLKSETLVFLLRSLRRTEAHVLFPHLENIIAETIYERIARIVGPYRRHFESDPNKAENYDDFRMSIIEVFFKKLYKENSDEADYAEVSFGQFVTGLANNEIKKYFKEKVRAGLHDDFDNYYITEVPIAQSLLSTDHLRVGEEPSFISYFERNLQDRAEILKDALNILPEPVRTAWVLRNAEDWQIDSTDQSVPTLAAYFNVTGRTVRNWLEEADLKLAAWRTPVE